MNKEIKLGPNGSKQKEASSAHIAEKARNCSSFWNGLIWGQSKITRIDFLAFSTLPFPALLIKRLRQPQALHLLMGNAQQEKMSFPEVSGKFLLHLMGSDWATSSIFQLLLEVASGIDSPSLSPMTISGDRENRGVVFLEGDH